MPGPEEAPGNWPFLCLMLLDSVYSGRTNHQFSHDALKLQTGYDSAFQIFWASCHRKQNCANDHTALFPRWHNGLRPGGAARVPKFSSNAKLALSPCRSKQLHQNGPTRHQGPLPPCVAHSPVVIHQGAEIHPTPNWRWKTKAEGRFKANLGGGGFIVIWRCMLRRQFLELAALIGVDRLPL